MKKDVHPNRLKYSIGSMEWSNFYGIPIFFDLFGILLLIADIISKKKINVTAIYFIIVGVILFIVQDKKLHFKSFKLNCNLDEFKSKVRDILQQDGWDIEYDNQNYMQAVFRKSIYSTDLLTIKYLKSEIKWNLVNHPESSNSVASLFSLNLKGKKTMKKIITSTHVTPIT